MGQPIDQEEFEPQDYERFSGRLQENLLALKEVLAWPGFGVGARSLGAELEMFLVDADGAAVTRSVQVRKQAGDPSVALELNRFNLEVNPPPLPLAGKPFRAMAEELDGVLSKVRAAARSQGTRMALIGILPTLTYEQLGHEAMTRKSRYRALSSGILSSREAPLQVRIDGDEPLNFEWDEVTLQGANTSFQLHLRVAPRDFARSCSGPRGSHLRLVRAEWSSWWRVFSRLQRGA